MKRVVNVSLGGMVFSFEEDAYLRLKEYLEGLERKFRHSKDVRDIMGDIESRMAEHFRAKLPSADMVISIAEVERVIGIMGSPSDFDDEDFSSQKGDTGRKRPRLFRDPEGGILGGVCSGLGYHWDIDPLILRILFVLFAFAGAGGILIYIVLWIVTPEARSIADRLEMTGKTINAENIGRSFSEK